MAGHGATPARLTPEILADLYLDQRLSCRQIADRCGYASMSGVQSALKRAGIPARKSWKRPHIPAHPKELLELLYVGQGKSHRAIATELGYRSHAQVGLDLKAHGIPARPRSAPAVRDRRPTPPRPPDPARRPDTEVALTRRQFEALHYEQALTIDEIAARIGTGRRQVVRWAADRGLTVRRHHASAGAGLRAGGERRLAALYARRDVGRALERHGVPRRDAPEEKVHEIALHRRLLDDLYIGCGLSSVEIGLLMARSSATVMRALRLDEIPVRPPPPTRPPQPERPARAPVARGTPITRELLDELYVRQNLSVREVATRCGWQSVGPVRSALRREGVTIRRMTVSRVRKVELTRELLVELYVTQGLSAPAMVASIGDYSVTTILEALKRERIPVRSPRYTSTSAMPELTEQLLRQLYVDERLRVGEIAHRLGYARAAISRALREHGIVIEIRRGRPRERRLELDRGTLEELYVHRDLSAEAVGEAVGVSAATVLHRLHDYGLPVRRNRWEHPIDAGTRLDRLRTDRRVRAALIEAGVPPWREMGTPIPENPLPAKFLRRIYQELDLSLFDIELLTGRGPRRVREDLVVAGIPIKPRLGYGGPSAAQDATSPTGGGHARATRAAADGAPAHPERR